MPQAAWAAASIVVLVAIWLVGVRSGALGDLVRTGVSRVLSRRVEATAVGPKAASPTAEVLTSWAVKATETMATSTDATETPTFVPTLTRTASVTPTATFTSTATRTPAATASPTAALPSATPRIHVVVSGDYIEKLAVVYDVDQDAIAAANGITLETILQLGQELVIPAPGESPEATAVPPGSPTPTPGLTATSSDEKAVALPTVSTPTKALTATSSPTPRPAGRPATHTVSEGENLSYLAMKYDVSMQEIAEANDIAVSAILSIGQELVIPGLDATPTPTLQPTQTSTPLATVTPTATRVPTPTWVYRAPMPLYPPSGDAVPQEGELLLGWTSAGVLSESDHYLVDIQVQSESFQPLERTELLARATSVRVEIKAIGGSGAGELLSWRVRVVRLGADGRVAVSPTSVARWISVDRASME